MHILTPILASLSLAAPVAARQTASATCSVLGAADQLTHRLSPLDSATVDLGGAAIKICYGRPAARGRVIMGGLVPFGEPWRLGANEATTIHLPVAAVIGHVRLEPGVYSLYAIPGQATWQIVINRKASRWGIPIDSTVRTQDLGVDTVNVEKVDGQPIETLTLRFSPPAGGATELVIEWEKTRVRIPVHRAG